MKILIVDDESYKIKEIMKIIDSIEDSNSIEVHHALDLKNAKTYLKNYEVDLLITDLNLPEACGQLENPIGGYELIDEIIENDFLFKPHDILILTEYDTPDERKLFQKLKYDPSSTLWVDVIRAKIEYLLIKHHFYTKDATIFDVAIITAVKTETESVNKLSDSWAKLEFDNDPTIYYKTDFSNDIRVVTAQQSEMGMSSSATLTTKMISHFNPKYIIMVGIAAGVGDGKNLGDIIFPSEVWNYSSGKYITTTKDADSSLLNFIPDPSSIKLDPKILSKSLQDFSSELSKIKSQWISTIDKSLNIISGPMACGTAVVANPQIVDDLVKQHSRKTVGLDMESYGMFYAAINSIDREVLPICIKSICDFADADKGDDFQKYAAYTSTNFMKYFIENHLEF